MSLGLAMIVRNCADTLPAAIEPLLPYVDEVSIVLGGVSSDDTPDLVGCYATALGKYTGPMNADGALLDFAAARQQSFDQLKTEWAIVVDADDCWQGLEHLHGTLDKAEASRSPLVSVKYFLGKNIFYQPRVFWRDAGHWRGAIHEDFTLTDPDALRWITSDVYIENQPTPGRRPERRRQNVEIALATLRDDPDNARTWAHLTNDYILLGCYEEAINATEEYLRLWDGEFHDELYYVVYNKARSLIHLGKLTQALAEVMRLLSIAGRGSAWSMLADLAYQLAAPPAEGKALLELAVFAADKALNSGLARVGYPESTQWSAGLPCHIKAMALRELGREAEALAMLDLGVRLDPDDEWMQQDRNALCLKLNQAP